MMFLFVALAQAADPPPALGSWGGVSAPSAVLPLGAPAGVGLIGNARWASRSAWLQPELRVSYTEGVSLDAGVSDTASMTAVFGARFGRDRGLYGGLLSGAELTVDYGEGRVDPGLGLQAVLGYAVPVGEHVRISPEVTVGTLNTLSVRVEWGGG